ncbi:hypothetical protein Tco_0344775 [Tanacetum coccineum]
MDANKNIDFEHVQCPPESKLIIKNHPLRFSIAASSSVPWIYMAQFWHTLNEDGSKYRLTFMLDKKELSRTLDDFRTIFHLPQATDNDHDSFVPPPSFLDMEGLHYSLHHPTSLIPYPRFTKIIISHYMTNFLEISRRVRDRRSTRLTSPALVPTVDKANEMILQDTLQVKIEKMVEGPENVIDDSSIPKESLEVEITNDEDVEITNVVIPVNVNEEKEEITDEVYELKQREKGKIVEKSRSTPFPTPIRSLRIHTHLVSLDTKKLQELTVTNTTLTPSLSLLNTKLSAINWLLSLFKAKPARFKHYKSFFQELQGHYGYLFEHLRAKFLSIKSFDT